MDKRKQQRCLRNLKGMANLEFCKIVADFGNDNLGHIYKFTPNQIMKVIEALYGYCVQKGKPVEGAEEACATTIEINWSDGMIRIHTWSP